MSTGSQPQLDSVAPSPTLCLAELSSTVRGAWDASFMGSFSEEVADQLLADAQIVGFEAGERVHARDDRGHWRMMLIVEGFARATMAWTDGRRATIRYVGPGEVLGLPSMMLTAAELAARDQQQRQSGHTLSGSSLERLTTVSIPNATFLALAERHTDVAFAAARELTKLLARNQEMLALNVFLPIRARVAHHLLDLAVRDGEQFVVRASQAFIAESIGSVREVVSRTLKDMERQGLISRSEGQIVLTDAAAMHRASL